MAMDIAYSHIAKQRNGDKKFTPKTSPKGQNEFGPILLSNRTQRPTIFSAASLHSQKYRLQSTQQQ